MSQSLLDRLAGDVIELRGAFRSPGVRLVIAKDIEEAIETIQALRSTPAVVTPEKPKTVPPPKGKQAYRERVRAALDQAPPAVTSPLCPECGGPMLRKRNSKTNQPFWGCADFPTCKGVRSSAIAQARMNALPHRKGVVRGE